MITHPLVRGFSVAALVISTGAGSALILGPETRLFVAMVVGNLAIMVTILGATLLVRDLARAGTGGD